MGTVCNEWLSIEMPTETPVSISQMDVDIRTSGSIGGLVYTNQSMAELEHVVSAQHGELWCHAITQGHIPERYNDKLSVLCPILDVVGNYRNIPEIQRGINFVHKIQWRGLTRLSGW